MALACPPWPAAELRFLQQNLPMSKACPCSTSSTTACDSHPGSNPTYKAALHPHGSALLWAPDCQKARRYLQLHPWTQHVLACPVGKPGSPVCCSARRQACFQTSKRGCLRLAIELAALLAGGSAGSIFELGRH